MATGIRDSVVIDAYHCGLVGRPGSRPDRSAREEEGTVATEDQKVIFSMVQVSKTHGQKTVLRDFSLGFFYGAKIGVLGLNGAG
ncbi:MAG: hypothetical protein AB1Z65_18265, partial [Candidatus Sulfomarinibacteraceae bacterium]